MIIILLIVFLGVSGFYAYINYSTKKWTSLVYPGVKIGDLDISGKTLAQAKDMVSQKYQSTLLKKNVNIKTPQKTYSLNFAKMSAKYNVDEVVNEAFNYGKDLSLYKKYKLIRKPESKLLNMKFTYDSKPLSDLIANMKKEINSNPKNASIYRSGNYFVITPDKKGYTLMDDKLKKEIISKINGDINSPDILVNAEIKTV